MNQTERYTKDERELRKYLGHLICAVRLFESQVDCLYHPASPVTGVERGKKLAEHLNALTMTNDRALYFGMGFDYKQDGATKRKHGTNIRPILKLASKTKRG